MSLLVTPAERAATPQAEAPVPQPPAPTSSTSRRPRPLPNGQLVVGAVLIAAIAAMAIVSLFWTPYDPTHAVAADRLQHPSAAHPMGTDRYGRDVLSGIMAGAQITLLVGTVSVLIGAAIGVPFGILAGMRPKRLGPLIMGGSDVVMAFPGLLLAIVFGAVFGGGTMSAMIALGIGSAPAFARVARSGTMQVMSMDYIFAARAANRPGLSIAIDGGINPETAGDAAAAGVSQFVAGSAVFRAGGGNYAAALAELAEAARRGHDRGGAPAAGAGPPSHA